MPNCRPQTLKNRVAPPDGKPYGVEVHIPGKPVQAKGFDNYDDGQRYLAQVRQLQKSVQLYVRFTFRDWSQFYYKGTGRVQPVAPVKGKLFCSVCGDYTKFTKASNLGAYDIPACEYCGISTDDWNVKSYNGLWPTEMSKKRA